MAHRMDMIVLDPMAADPSTPEDGEVWYHDGGKHFKVRIAGTGNLDAILAASNIAATTDPGVNDDVSVGYTVGSVWINVTLDKGFVCVDSTDGAAVWIQTTSSGATDADAVHDNVAAEISVLTEKVTPVSGDHLLIEDSAAANVKKRVQIGNLPGATDGAAIHDDTAAEISAVTEKTAPVAADLILIEDSAAANAKKRVQLGNVPLATTEVTATGNITTTSATYVTATTMTITPAAGTYLVWFSTSVSNSGGNGAGVDIAIAVAGTVVTASERSTESNRSDEVFAAATHATAVVNGSQAITAEWLRTTNGTATMRERTLTILKVA